MARKNITHLRGDDDTGARTMCGITDPAATANDCGPSCPTCHDRIHFLIAVAGQLVDEASNVIESIPEDVAAKIRVMASQLDRIHGSNKWFFKVFRPKPKTGR
jgi:hypothetical protein